MTPKYSTIKGAPSGVTSKIGELILGRFKTEIHLTQDLKKLLKSEKISMAHLIPNAWLWYDNELLEIIDENGDGKPDDKFGKSFKIVYLENSEPLRNLEQTSLMIAKTTIKNIVTKYAILKIEN